MFKKLLATLFVLAASVGVSRADGYLLNIDRAVLGTVETSDYSGYVSTQIVFASDGGVDNSTWTFVSSGPLVITEVQFGGVSGNTTAYIEIKDISSSTNTVAGKISLDLVNNGSVVDTIYDLNPHIAVASTTLSGSVGIPSRGAALKMHTPLRITNGYAFRLYGRIPYTWVKFKYRLITR